MAPVGATSADGLGLELHGDPPGLVIVQGSDRRGNFRLGP